MASEIESSEGLLKLPEPFVRAVVCHGEYLAELTIAFLSEKGMFPRTGPDGQRTIGLSAAVLLELGAILQLGVWERQGLRAHIDADLPSYRDAVTDFVQRTRKGPAAFPWEAATSFSQQVLQVWLERFAWDGREFFEADVLVSNVDEDVFVDVLADFLWNHRHAMVKILANEGELQ